MGSAVAFLAPRVVRRWFYPCGAVGFVKQCFWAGQLEENIISRQVDGLR